MTSATRETPEQRAARYHRMAADTRKLARRSDDPQVAAAYLELAEHWDQLAHSAAYGMESANDDRAGESPLAGGDAAPGS